MVRRNFFLSLRGVSLVELMVAMVLVTVVFLAGISVYTTGFKFLRNAQTNDITTSPVISLEQVATRISLGNMATVDTVGPITGKQLHVRADFVANPAACGVFTPRNTPGNLADDGFWHFAFIVNAGVTALRGRCDNAPATAVLNTDPILINNVTMATSNFTLSNPSAAGNASVINIHVVTTSPAAELDTNVALGALPKR